jgi:hypothetical protein
MFKIHYGTCLGPCGKEDQLIVIKKGFCQKCNHEQKQAKKKAAGKKSGQYRYERKPTGEKHVFEAKLEQIGDSEETKCFVCQQRIALVMPHNFAHVLSKGCYPLFRLNPDNIVLLCHKIIADKNGNGCHYLYDMTPHSELKGEGWERLFELRDKLKEEYKSVSDL